MNKILFIYINKVNRQIFYLFFLFSLIFLNSISATAATTCCGYTDAGNTYPCQGGNCTWWAAYNRPETNFPGTGRDAKIWLELANQNGLPIGNVPQKGSIAVFENFYPPYGHVAYVEEVLGNTFRVSEMSWNGAFGWCVVRDHVYNINEATVVS